MLSALFLGACKKQLCSAELFAKVDSYFVHQKHLVMSGSAESNEAGAGDEDGCCGVMHVLVNELSVQACDDSVFYEQQNSY